MVKPSSRTATARYRAASARYRSASARCRSATALRRSALLSLAALCALTSCGIPTTGVVQAGGPAGGVVPTVRVYFVRNGTLIGVSRPTDAPGDVDSAVEELLLGPSDAERSKQITTDLLLPGGFPTLAPDTSATADTGVAPQESLWPTDRVTVRERDDGITVHLTWKAGELGTLGAAQIICTARAARRVADPGAEPPPVSVTDAAGRRVGETTQRCPDT